MATSRDHRVTSRTSMCNIWRERFLFMAGEIQCPPCRRVQCENGRGCHCSIFSFINRILHHEHTSDQLPLSLNCKPSPFEVSSSRIRLRRKRALLIGIMYNENKYKLKGTINDVKMIRDLLVNTFHFLLSDILVLTDREPDKEFIPTKKNILRSLHWLVEGCQAGDSLVFYFSGHGLRQPDFDEDEIDGFDETICPVDFVTEGMILDNDINSILVQPLPKDVTLHAIVDACHSGTILDLEYVYNNSKKKWEDNKPPSGVRKGTKGGLAISICACRDNEIAIDTAALTGKSMGGVLTFILVKAVTEGKNSSYGELLDYMCTAIDNVNKNACFCTKIVTTLRGRTLRKPQLSASAPFDIQRPFEL